MLRFVAVAAVLALAAARVPIMPVANETALPGEWIVVMRGNSTLEERTKHMTSLRSVMETDTTARIFKEYSFMSFFGYAIAATGNVLEHILNADSVVEFIEPNQRMFANADCLLQEGATWGIVRTDSRTLNYDGLYDYPEDSQGEGVDVYVVDTGIYLQHSDFEGRAVWGDDEVDDPSPETDGNGHGTHVAGTIMSKTYGLAKKATAIAVRVLGNDGSGTNAGVIAGVNFVCSDHRAKSNLCVANMSLGGGKSTALNNAVDQAVTCGCQFAVAAGNSNANACNYSPASASQCVTVAATDDTDARSSFSNWGTCAQVFAPGTAITSTWIGGAYAERTISGTSMAAPHVAGVMAKVLSSPAGGHYAPADLKAYIISSATSNTVTNPNTTPNRLLYNGCA